MGARNHVSRTHLGEIIVDELSNRNFIYKEEAVIQGGLYRGVIWAWLGPWTIKIVRNYRGTEPRVQIIEILDTEENCIHRIVRENDINIVEHVLACINVILEHEEGKL